MQQIVINALAKLVAEGKEPTVALVKAKLTQNVPMPVIIDVLSKYKKDPSNFELSIEKSVPTQSNPAHSQTQLDRIEQKLDKLIALLEQQNVRS